MRANDLTSPDVRVVRFGLLGTGWWADNVHAVALAAHPAVDFVGVWGRNAEKAAVIAERHGTVAQADLDTLLATVDAVAIALTPEIQPELAYRAADAGCHLILEKPLALSVAAADRIVDAAKRAGVSSIVAAWGITQSDAMTCWYRDVIAPERWDGGVARIVAALASSDSPFRHSPWRREYGALWDVGPHALDVLLRALGPIEEVAAVHGPGDTVQLAIRHQAGGVSSAILSLTAAQAAEHMAIEFWGAAGRVRPPVPDPTRTWADQQAEKSARAFSALLTSIHTGEPTQRDVRFGAEVVRVLAAAERFLARPSQDRGEQP